MINMASHILAIDPGVDGAIAYVCRDEKGEIFSASVADIKTYPSPLGNIVNIITMKDDLPFKRALPDLAIIEMPLGFHDQSNEVSYGGIRGKVGGARTLKMSAKTRDLTMINFGRLVFLAEGFLHDPEAWRWGDNKCRHKQWHTVQPSSWKAKLGVTSDKRTSLELARAIFPMLADKLKRQKDHNRAEALLLAEYAHHHVWLPNQIDK